MNSSPSAAWTIQQALRAKDGSLLDTALESGSNDGIVAATVTALPGPDAYAVFSEILDRVERCPSRLYRLINWIDAILLAHFNYFRSSPECRQALVRFREHAEERMQLRKTFVGVKGWVDVLCRQMTAANDRSRYESSLTLELD
eukprot:GHVU01191215.1.p1 GENE.GHVU01191215.1~~GHVU01191215.1.p1  ORF type:complete len:144 (-),score=13.96 GHVU01191215.1:1257-1688(-)